MNYRNNKKNKTIIAVILFIVILSAAILLLVLTGKAMLRKITDDKAVSYNPNSYTEVCNNKFQKLNYVEPVVYERNDFNIILEDKTLPENITGEFKTYMDYRKITRGGTIQYELQQLAITDEDGFRRYNDLYMIALGTYFSPVAGLEFEIEFCNGKVINCITGDVKDNKHTDQTNSYNESNGNILEFIVDVRKIDELSRIMGDMSYSNMEGEIVRITQIRQEENHDEY